MKRKMVLKGMVAAFSLVCLVILSGMFASPVLYSDEQVVSTPAHARPVPNERAQDGRMDMVVPAMADLMDQSGTIVLHVREKDFEKAEEDLVRYMEASRSFNNLVVSLDMTESDISEFTEGNMENMGALATLLEESRRMDELSRLEVVYQDEKDSENFYSVTYEGEALQMKMEEALKRYQGQQTAMTDIGTKYDLPVSSYVQSVSAFAGVVDETDRTRQGWGERHDDGRPAPSISVSPPSVSYGDSVRVSGVTSGRSAETLSLFLDGREWTTATVDRAGRYAAAIPASSISAGRHLLYATHDGGYSEVAEFEVLAAPAALTLEVGPSASGWEENIVCSGTLLSRGEPVEGAGVTITSDDGTTLSAKTDAEGSYSCTGRIEPGPRELRAAVSGEALPLRYTVSDTVEMDVPEPGALVTALVMKAAAVLIAGIGVALAVRHRQARRRSRNLLAIPRRPVGPPEGVWPGTAPDAVSQAREWTPSEVKERYADLISRGRYGDAIRLLYLSIAARIGRDQKIGNYNALTPREVLGIATAAAPAGGLSGFIGAYEKVRYGRSEPSYEQTACLQRLYDQNSDYGGERD
ncbi:carboxypeptidase regulatory-like domain-containing protein [Methanofollis aquaemaris]|uniref:Carboxypeptidase regulatory-like domain-containing protein n=1 Tax=Methanofollis aquaemaris TaxID=126734 RepID=A0A8A3S256_9EURY|nr:carboxypeptidase-like regulatory domain-containing protein [Methanofollis aquaemaris]QSZ66437.1 carboxypeptidase regulatory-like domain-containing protein [Methanofollis aquaemaris]